MNTPSYTATRELRRCPRRYFFRYRYKPSPEEAEEYDLRRGLFSLPALAGYIIHQELSLMVHSIDGSGRWEIAEAADRCAERFFALVSTSLATRAGQLLDIEQLAETVNGVSYDVLKDDIEFWKSTIPTALANGKRLYLEISRPCPSSGVTVETNKVIEWKNRQAQRVGVLDVLITSPARTILIDFKVHSIDTRDIGQICSYYQHFDQVNRGLTGWLVDVLNGKKEQIPPRARGWDDWALELENCASQSRGRQRQTDFKATPTVETCRECPYASMCQNSAFTVQG